MPIECSESTNSFVSPDPVDKEDPDDHPTCSRLVNAMLMDETASPRKSAGPRQFYIMPPCPAVGAFLRACIPVVLRRVAAFAATSKNGGVESSKKPEEDLGESIEMEPSI